LEKISAIQFAIKRHNSILIIISLFICNLRHLSVIVFLLYYVLQSIKKKLLSLLLLSLTIFIKLLETK